MDIKKRVVISGGTSGIGLATADILSKEGWKPFLSDEMKRGDDLRKRKWQTVFLFPVM